MNQYLYKEQCFERRFIPFINSYHSNCQCIFWPDLASTHYANSVLEFMVEKNIKFVSRNENPANFPECRPIELFWTILKQKVYQGNWKAKSLKELEKRIRLLTKRISSSTLEKLLDGMVDKIRDIKRNGGKETRLLECIFFH